MIKVSIIGTGNVSHHLVQAILGTEGILLMQVFDSRTPSFEETLIHPIQDDGDPQSGYPDIYIIAVSDDAIASVSRKLIKTKSLVVHTSGSVSMNALPDGIRRGVFYPLQTFSKEANVDFKEVPVCIEAENKADLQLLHDLSKALSEEVHEVPSNSRVKLHLAAVFANNFTNHLYKIGSDICREHGLPFSILKPLIKETAQKIERISPDKAQTGPAKRGDTATIKEHLDLLASKENKEIYALISQSIQRTYGEKL